VADKDTGRLILMAAAILFMTLPSAGGLGATVPDVAGSDRSMDEGGATYRAATYVLSIDASNATQKVDMAAGQRSATYSIQIQNNGDSGMPECGLQLTPWPPSASWSYNFIPSAPFSVSPGETKTVLVVVYPDPNSEPKRYTFTLKPSANVSGNQITINLDIVQHAGVEVRAPPSREAHTGETLEFDFEIVNTGNWKDSFFISVGTGPLLMPGYIKDQNNWTGDIASQKCIIKTVVVALPYDLKTSEGTAGYKLSLTARSNYCQTVEDANWTTIVVPHVYDISLGISPPNATLLPGQQAEFTVTVLNLGNGPDNVTVGLGSSFDLSNWTVSLARNRLTIGAWGQNTTKLKVTPPLNVLRGTYILQLVARSSGPPAPEEPVERSEPVLIRILPVRGLLAQTTNISAPSAIEPGEAVRIPFNFTNIGNGEDTVNITVIQKPQNWYAGLDIFRDIRLAPTATHQAVLTVQASANLSESLNQTYLIVVRVANADLSSFLDLTFGIPVKPVYNWTVAVNGSSTAQVNLFVTRRQTFFIDIENTGNAPDGISLTFSGPNASWGRLDMPLVPLGIGERKTVPVGVEVPPVDGLDGGTYALTVNLASMNRPNLTYQTTFAVKLRRFDPADTRPVLEVFPARPKLEMGHGATTELNISVQCRRDDVPNVTVRFIVSAGLDLKVELLTPSDDLVSGDNRSWVLRISAPDTDRDVEGFILVCAVGENQTAQWVQIPIKIKAAARHGATISVEAVGLALVVFLALGGIAVGWNEVVILAIITQFLPLYSKIRREEVLDQYTRGKIHGYIIANPGEHYNSLKAQLDLKNGTLAYHLRVLEREGYVKSARDGPFKRFYPQEAVVPKNRSEFSSIQEIVLENVRASPGITQNDVAVRMGVSSQVVNYHIRNLVRAGRIRLQREGRTTRCYLK
jgi:uncharacterized membrane protein/predicted transcriptional regulator